MIEVTDISSAAYTDYREYKAALDEELQQSTESFVRIGYMLKLARDTDILQGSGYTNVKDFARAEYNIDKTLVSRFISINDRFSEGGNSDRLKEQYRGFGYAKLAIMLQLPDAVNEEITPAYSKADVLVLKEEVDAERAVTDIEVMLEEKDEVQEAMATGLDRVIHQLGHDFPEMYAEFHRALRAAGEEKEVYRAVQEILAPSGEGIHSVRIMGTGRLLLSVRGTDREVTLTSVRSGEKENYTWERMAAAVRNIVGNGKEVCESYEVVYGEKYPEAKKKEVAPVQPEAGQKKEAPKLKMQGKVTKAPKKMPPVPAPAAKETGQAAADPEKGQERLMQEEEIVETVENTMADSDSGENGTQPPGNDMENMPETAEILNAEQEKGRLTESDGLGNWGIKGLSWKDLCTGRIITQKAAAKLYGCLYKLKKYEDTGLGPEEIEALKGSE